MDRRRFDALAKRLGDNATSRRTAASGLAAWALTATLGPPAAGAKHRKKKCKACHVRQGKKCVKAADDSSCKGDGRCLNGKCNPKPNCAPAEAPCSHSSECCSHECSPLLVTHCLAGDAGARCLTDADCGSANCAGYRRQP
ncbi:MAG TPA: hypothetical protein VFI22_17145 [Thermomicrobiales bacterium]|nr:hypothetical protein [Thermomicrobiales bacterium]